MSLEGQVTELEWHLESKEKYIVFLLGMISDLYSKIDDLEISIEMNERIGQCGL